MSVGGFLQQWVDQWHDQNDPDKTYHYSARKKPESAYGRFLTVISIGLGVVFLAMQILTTVHIGQSIEDQKVRQVKMDEAARCMDNPWAVGCPPSGDTAR